MGAELIAANVADFVASLMGLGPFIWVGHDGEKWSLILQQQGQMNQCDVEFCGLCVFVLLGFVAG